MFIFTKFKGNKFALAQQFFWNARHLELFKERKVWMLLVNFQFNETPIAVKTFNRCQVFWCKLKVKDVEIADDSALGD